MKNVDIRRNIVNPIKSGIRWDEYEDSTTFGRHPYLPCDMCDTSCANTTDNKHEDNEGTTFKQQKLFHNK